MWQPLLAGVLVVASVLATDRWYEGKWTAEFEGVTFVRFELAVISGNPVGRISLGNVEVNADGGLRSVSPAPDRLSEIFDVAVRGAVRKLHARTPRVHVATAQTRGPTSERVLPRRESGPQLPKRKRWQ